MKNVPFLGDKAYNVLKWIAQILLPAFGAFYFGLADLWELPNAYEVVGTVTLVDTFLGVILGLSAAAYNASGAQYDGSINVEYGAGMKKNFVLNLEEDPYALDEKKSVNFKVVKHVPQEFVDVKSEEADNGGTP